MRRWRPSIGRASAVSIAAVAALLLAGVAYASWSRSVTGGPISVTTATLDAPTSLAATVNCTRHVGNTVGLTWTASTDKAITGYEIFRSTTSGSGYGSIGTVSGRTTTAYTDGTPALSTQYYYVVQASRSTWRSVNSGQAGALTLDTNCH